MATDRTMIDALAFQVESLKADVSRLRDALRGASSYLYAASTHIHNDRKNGMEAAKEDTEAAAKALKAGRGES